MKCRWGLISICLMMFAIDSFRFFYGDDSIYLQLATLWALVGTMSWLICKVIDEIIEYMDRF
jgi:hypothetical protein